MLSIFRSCLLPSLLCLLAAVAPVHAASIGDKVFIDGNKNGIFNTGEPGLPNIGLTLTWAGPDGNLATAGDNQTFTQTTNATGDFNFTGLSAGNYSLDLDNTTLSVGLAPAGGSDPRAISGLGAADVITNADFAVVSSGLNLTLWTLNEADPGTSLTRSGAGSPRLFCFTNYADTLGQSLFIDYGRLVWRDSGGTIQFFAGGDETNAESLAIDTRNGDLYIVINPATGGFTVPVLFKTSLFALRPNAAQIELTRIGEVRDSGSVAATAIEGIAFDEPNNLIYAVNTEGNVTADPERLLQINPQTGQWASRGFLQGNPGGTSYALTETDGLEVVPQYSAAGQVIGGTFYGYDQWDNHLYQINPGDGSITALVNTESNTATDIETIAWDEQLGRMIAVDNGLYQFSSLPIGGGATQVFSTYAQQGLANSSGTNDLEGAGFFLRGAFPLAQIGNHVWVDANGNGQWDTGEASVANVSVDLYFDGNDDGDFDDAGETSPYYSTVTNSQGFYSFEGLQAGRFQVRLPASNYAPGQPLAQWSLSSPITDTADNREEIDDNGSQVAPGAVVIGPAIILSEGEIDRTVDFGMMAADFGDAADVYAVVIADDGAWHPATGPTLGAARDAEADGQPSSDASADGADEDGVTLPAIQATTTVSVTIVSSTAGARLDGWIDWNRDGDWDDVGEQVFTSTVLTAGSNILSITAPPTVTPGASFAHFRISSAGGLLPTGGALDGEVEDYPVTLYELGSISGVITATLLAEGGGGGLGQAGPVPVEGASIQLFTDPNNDGYPYDGLPVDDPSLPGFQPYVTLSLADGSYLFDDLLSGSYVVMMTPPPGFRVFGDEDESADDSGSPADAPNPPDDHLIGAFLGVGEADTQNNFTIDPMLGRAGSLVWLDENSNGRQDAGERGIPNVSISIYDFAGTLVAETVTDTRGGWSLLLTEGSYFVDVVEATLPAGVTQTPLTNEGFDFGNQDQSSSGPGDYGYAMSVSAGAENLTGDFGYNLNPTPDVTGGEGTAALGDRVWVDVDNDGAQDPDESGIAGVELTLCTAGEDGLFDTPDDAAVQTAVTDVTGYYLFDDLAPGAYVVKVTDGIPPGLGYDQRGDPDHFGTAAGLNDARTTVPVVLAPGDVFLNADFGYQADVSNCVGNLVWLDSNGNGVANSGEEGIAGVSVALISDTDGDGVWDAGEPIIATDVTDSIGIYHFRGLQDGNYLIWVNDTDHVLAGLDQSYDFDGTATPHISAVDLDSAGTNPSAVLDYDHDFGYTPAGQTDTTGAIGDYVWLDADRDGVQDSTESGVEGVLMGLYESTGSTLISTTLTDEYGRYWFGGLDAALTYVVKVEAANTAPGGTLEGMTGTWDADSGLTPDAMSSADLAASGSDGNNDTDALNNNVNPGQDFGYAAPSGSAGSIGNLVWLDQNADGVSQGASGPDGLPGTDDDEPGIAGVTLDLYRDLNGNGAVDPGEPRAGSTATGGSGAYLFSGLPYGSYVVDVTDTAGTLYGYWHSTGTPGADNHSQTDAYAAVISAGTPSDLTADFGYYLEPAALGNYVFLDNDRSGTQSAGDTGLPGVIVTLTIEWPTEEVTVVHTTTDSTGHYSFGSLLLDENQACGSGPSADPNGPAIPADSALPVFTISIAGLQSALTGYAETVADNGISDLLDSDMAAGVVAKPVRGLTNVSAQSPADNENPIASYDFGYVVDKAAGFTAWQALNPLGGQNGPTQNPDGDRYNNFLEYAFCLPPGSGINEPVCLIQTGATSAAYQYTRIIGAPDANFEVQTTSALGTPTLWSPLGILPLSVDNGNGTETLYYPGTVPGGAPSGSTAFYRVAVTDTTTSQTYYSEIQGWMRHDITAGCETFSCPLLPKAKATGAIGTVTGQTLDLAASLGTSDLSTLLTGGASYYLEITSGDHEGARYDIASVTASTITLAEDSDLCAAAAPYNTTSGPAPASLTGDSYAIYTHRTVAGMFPTADYQPGNSLATADRILIKRGSAWDIYWHYTNGAGPGYWDLDGDAQFSDEGTDVIPVSQGLFIHKVSPGTLEHLCVGEVRTWAYRAPLCETDGCTLVAPGYPLDQSPADLRILLSDGWDGDFGPLTADKFLIWNADSNSAIPGYTCYWLADAGVAPWQYWTLDGDSALPDRDTAKVFKQSRSAFLKPKIARPQWSQPPPFTP